LVPAFPPNWTPWLDASEKVFRILAYVVGGIWAYFKFFRGRTFRPRLEPSVAAHLQRRAPQRLLTVAVKVKNVGLSRVGLLQEGTGVRVYRRDEGLQWRRVTTLEILKGHGWIEPAETIEEHVLTEIPGEDPPALKIELTLQSTKKTQWEVVTIVI
jgi:hypothetical protein